MKLAVMFFLGYRRALLDRIYAQFRQLAEKTDFHLFTRVARAEDAPAFPGQTVIVDPRPVFDENGEHFPRFLEEIYRAHIDPLQPDWVGFWPDDGIFAPGGIDEAVAVMQSGAADVIRAHWLYFWEPDKVRLDLDYIPCDPRFWRWSPGQKYDPRRQTLSPLPVHDTGRVYTTKALWHDFGWSTEEDRRIAWHTICRLGRFEARARQLVTPPTKLVSYNEV